LWQKTEITRAGECWAGGRKAAFGQVLLLAEVQVPSVPPENIKRVAPHVQPPFLFLPQHQVPD